MTDFLPAIQWLATLAFAFVAIDFVESFTISVCKKIFMSDDYISLSFQRCEGILPDLVTFANLQPTVINGKSTNDRIQCLQRDTEIIKEKIKTTILEEKNNFAKECQIKSLSSIALYILLTCSTILIAGGFEGIQSEYIHSFIFIQSSLSMVYFALSWFIGEKNTVCRFLSFSSYRHSILSFFIVSIIALCIGFLPFMHKLSIHLWFAAFTSFIFICFINFIILAIKIGFKANNYKKKIDSKEKELFKECYDIREQVEKLIVVADVGQTLQDKSTLD